MHQESFIELESSLTYDAYKEFFMFSLFKSKSYRRYLAIYYVISTIGIAVSLLSGISFGFRTVDIVVLILLPVIALIMSYLVLIAPKSYYKTAKHLVEGTVVYRFTPEGLEEEAKGTNVSGNTFIRYSALYRIYERDNVIYIFINNSQAYIVPKSNIPKEALEQLRLIFKSNLGKKYYNFSKE